MRNFFKARIVPLFGIIAVVAVIGFSMIACDDGSGDNDNNGDGNGNGGNGTTITYTVSANGSSSSATTALTFTFSADPGALTASNITVSGTASKGSAAVSGIGNSRTLSPITVSANGSANISITKDGIETGTKTATVYSGSNVNSDPKTITITGLDGKNGSLTIYIIQTTGTPAGGSATIASGSASFALKTVQSDETFSNNNWTGTGSYWLALFDEEGKLYVYSEGKTAQQLGVSSAGEFPSQKFPRYDISSATSTIAFNQFIDISDLD